MLTDSQKYLLEGAKEQHALAEKEIKKLYREHRKAKVSKEVFPEVYEGMMHTIGYWEGVKNVCTSVIEFMEMGFQEFRDFQIEQEKIRLHNERIKEEILKSIKELKFDAKEKPSEEE
jgi:hypothetical protein